MYLSVGLRFMGRMFSMPMILVIPSLQSDQVVYLQRNDGGSEKHSSIGPYLVFQ